MALKDLRSILKDGHELPINGRVWVIPHVTAQVGLRFQDFVGVAGKAAKAEHDGTDYTPTDEDTEVLSDLQEMDLFHEVLHSGLFEEMQGAGLNFAEIRIAAYYALFHAVFGEDKADAFWRAGGKASAPNRAARRTATQTRTGAARTTRKRA